MRHGIGYCPEDRKKEGIVAELSIRENIMLALQARRGWWRKISRQRAARDRRRLWIERLGIKARDAEQPIGLLSGGNQQKALLARWLATEPKMLILDEPTRGIDVAAKFDIMDRMLALCAKGLAHPVHLVGGERGGAREPSDGGAARPAQDRGSRGQRVERGQHLSTDRGSGE